MPQKKTKAITANMRKKGATAPKKRLVSIAASAAGTSPAGRPTGSKT